MNTKLVIVFALFCTIVATGYAHVPGYAAVPRLGTGITLNGVIAQGEWTDATVMNYGGITSYVKYINDSGTIKLFVAFHIPDSTASMGDLATVGLDNYNDGGGPGTGILAPKEDDMRCNVSRTGAMTEEWGASGMWFQIPYTCTASAQENVGGYWEAEFSIAYLPWKLESNHTNGFLLSTWDNNTGSAVSWPPSPNGNGMNLSTWGDLTWPTLGNIVLDHGDNSPSNHNWYSDPNASPNNVMLQFKVAAGLGEDVNFQSVTIRANGTGNDAADISSVHLVYDQNGNGLWDAGETELFSGIIPANDGTILMPITPAPGHMIPAGQTHSFLIVYRMSSSGVVGSTYWLTVLNASAVGVSTGQTLSVMGMPLVSAVKTIIASPTSAGYGSSNPASHNWFYNATGDKYNEMLQFYVRATSSGNVQLNSITLKGTGTGNEVSGIKGVYFALDSNNNGAQDIADVILAAGNYSANDGQLTLSPANGFTVPAGMASSFLVSYEMSSAPAIGNTFQVQLQNISGATNGQNASILGLPLTSGIKTTVLGGGGNGTQPPGTACNGTMAFVLPNSTAAGATITAMVGGLTSCNNKTVSIHAYSCNNTPACTVTLGNTGDSCNFTAPAYAGSYIYYSCFDKNANQNFDDAGEQAFDTLTVTSGTIKCDADNCGGCASQVLCTNAAGCNWCNGACTPVACGSETGGDGTAGGTGGTNGTGNGAAQGGTQGAAQGGDNSMIILVAVLTAAVAAGTAAALWFFTKMKPPAILPGAAAKTPEAPKTVQQVPAEKAESKPSTKKGKAKRFCTGCGAPLEAGSTFCAECGTKPQ